MERHTYFADQDAYPAVGHRQRNTLICLVLKSNIVKKVLEVT
jgi:hypothetical protein